MLSVIQLGGLIFISFAVSRAILRAKDKKISLGELFFWLVVWVGLIFVVFFPEVTESFADIIGIGRGVDIIIYGSIALLFYMIFRLYVKLEEAEMEITKLVREIAINKIKKKK